MNTTATTETESKCRECGRSAEAHKHSTRQTHKWRRITCKGHDTKWDSTIPDHGKRFGGKDSD